MFQRTIFLHMLYLPDTLFEPNCRIFSCNGSWSWMTNSYPLLDFSSLLFLSIRPLIMLSLSLSLCIHLSLSCSFFLPFPTSVLFFVSMACKNRTLFVFLRPWHELRTKRHFLVPIWPHLRRWLISHEWLVNFTIFYCFLIAHPLQN